MVKLDVTLDEWPTVVEKIITTLYYSFNIKEPVPILLRQMVKTKLVDLRIIYVFVVEGKNEKNMDLEPDICLYNKNEFYDNDKNRIYEAYIKYLTSLKKNNNLNKENNKLSLNNYGKIFRTY